MHIILSHHLQPAVGKLSMHRELALHVATASMKSHCDVNKAERDPGTAAGLYLRLAAVSNGVQTSDMPAAHHLVYCALIAFA